MSDKVANCPPCLHGRAHLNAQSWAGDSPGSWWPPHPQHAWPLALGTQGRDGAGKELGPALGPCQQLSAGSRGAGWAVRSFQEEPESRPVCVSPAAPSSVPSSWPIPSEGTTFTSALTSQAQPGLPKPSLHLESSASAQPLHRCSLGQGHRDLLLNPHCIRPQGLRVLLTIPACSPLSNTSAALLRTHRGSQGLLPARHLLPCYPSSPRPWLWDPLPRATTPHLQRLQEPELLAAKALFISHPLHQSQQSETPKLPASVGPQLLPRQPPSPLPALTSTPAGRQTWSLACALSHPPSLPAASSWGA